MHRCDARIGGSQINPNNHVFFLIHPYNENLMNRTRNVLFSYLIFAIGGYGTHLFSPWVYDDVPLIEKNDFLQLKFLFHFFRSFISDSNYSSVGYRPLPFAMFTLEKALFGPHPYLFRFDNILLLITTSLLIYLIA